MKIRLLDDRLIVKPIEPPQRTAGGIFLPASRSRDMEPCEGIVTHVGDGRPSEHWGKWQRSNAETAFQYEPERLPLRVKVGDKVLYNAYAVTKFEHEGEEFSVITERDVLGILDVPDALGVGDSCPAGVLVGAGAAGEQQELF